MRGYKISGCLLVILAWLGAWIVQVRAQEAPGHAAARGAGAQISQALATAVPFADIYARLDEQLAVGMGRIGARSRPEARPQEPSAKESSDDHYVAQTRGEFRRNQERSFAAAAAALKEAENRRNDSFFSETRAQCGTGTLTGAQIGMSQEQFESCGQEIRFGGHLTHVISLRHRGIDARLYVFAMGDVHKVYAVDRRITRIEARPWAVPKSALPRVGGYPPFLFDPMIVALSQGRLFGYELAFVEDWRESSGAELLVWADKRRRSGQVTAPFMWDPQRPGWVKLPPPPACLGRWHRHTLTVLTNDQVLIAGGLCDLPRLGNDDAATFLPQFATALWDAGQRAWLEVADLKQPRIYHTASALDGQRVMVVGGLDDPLTVAASLPEGLPEGNGGASVAKLLRPLDSVELLQDRQWHSLPSLRTARAQHTASLLPDGRLLVAGGFGLRRKAMAKVELWDPVQGAWLPGAPMRSARYGHAATVLADGRVLVTGGVNEQEQLLNTTELYDPERDTWSDGPPMPEHLLGHASLLLPDGRVLLAGGQVNPATEDTWLISWHPATLAWQAVGKEDSLGNVAGGRHRPSLVQATPAQVLVFGSRAVSLYRLPAHAASGDPESKQFDFPPEWWTEPKPEPVAAPVSPPQPLGQPGRWKRLLQDLWAARASIGWVVLGLLVLWGAGRWWRQRHRITDHENSPEPGAATTHQSASRAWMGRGLLYGGLLLLGGPHLIGYWNAHGIDMRERCQLSPEACLDPSTGLLAKHSAVPERSSLATPRIPCPFVGSWVTRRGNSEYRVDLHADGRYQMPATAYSAADHGHWAVQGKYMLWRSRTQQIAELDVNRIVSNDGQHFELVETNGLHSHFERSNDLPALKCSP